MKLTRILRFHQKQLWHSDREKIFVRLSEPPIYMEVLTDGRESANKIIKITKEIMNTDYRYQLESKGWTHNPPNTDLCDLLLK